jgi:TP901 family phage tail tape measure protein
VPAAATLTIVIDSVNNGSAALQDMSAQASTLGKSFTTLGASATAVGKSMTTGITLPVVGIAAAAAKMAVDFQQSMIMIKTQAGDTTDSIQDLSNQVLAMAKTSQFSPDELSEGLYHLASLGLRGADAMNALNTAQQLAAVGGADLESTSSALGAAIVTNIKGTQDYSEAAGTLNAIIGAGNMRMQDLVNALGTGVLPVFKNAGLSLSDFGAALATLTDNGQDASAAATHLRMTIALMEAPSQAAATAMGAIGLASNQLGMDMQTKGLIPALQDLQQHLLSTYGTTAAGKEQMAAALTEMFGGGKSSAAIQTLLDQLPRVQNKLQEITDTSGQFANDVQTQQETAAAKIKTAWSTIQADAIQLGSQALPVLAQALTVIVNDVNNLFTWYTNLSKAQKDILDKFIAFMAVVGPSLLIFGKLVSTVTMVSKAFGALGGVIKALTLTNFIGQAGRATTAVEGMGVAAGEAGGVAGAGGLLAALGPVGLGIGAVAIAAGAGYLAYKKWNELGVQPTKQSLDDFNQTAQAVGVTVTGTAVGTSMLDAAQQHVATSAAIMKGAQDKLKGSQDDYSKSQQTLNDKMNDYQGAQQNVQKALDTFGQNSPQYASAAQTVADKYDDLQQQLGLTASNSLSVVNNGGILATAVGIWKQGVADLGSLQAYLNDRLKDGVGIIANFGPVAGAQMGGVATLQGGVSGLVGSWGGFVTSVQNQGLVVASTVQGAQSTLSHVQGQASNLDSTLGSINNAIGILNSSGSGGIPLGSSHGATITIQAHAAGTDFAPGGLSLVGEEGPELINLPRGSKVLPTNKTQAILNGGSGGNTNNSKNIVINNTNVFKNQTDPLAFARKQAFELQRR